jgi:hypothetical protein
MAKGIEIPAGTVPRAVAAVIVAALLLAAGYWVATWVLDATDDEVVNALGAGFIGLFFLVGALLSLMLIMAPVIDAWSESRPNTVKPAKPKKPLSPGARGLRRVAAFLVAGAALLVGFAVVAALLGSDSDSAKIPAIAVVLAGVTLYSARGLYRMVRGSPPPLEDVPAKPVRRKKAKPARMANLAPTDMDTLEDAHIDTGPGTPQISHQVWRTASKRNTAFLVPIAGLLFILPLGLVLAIDGDMVPGVAITLVAVLMIGLTPVLRRRGREVMRLGFDWSHNVLWVERGGRLHWMPNANMIDAFELNRTVDGPMFDPGVMIMTDGAVAGTRDKAWTLIANRTDGHRRRLFETECHAGREARELLSRANQPLFEQE